MQQLVADWHRGLVLLQRQKIPQIHLPYLSLREQSEEYGLEIMVKLLRGALECGASVEREGHEVVHFFGFAIGGEELEELVVVDLHYL